MRARVRSNRALDFACRSAACAPPPAGTGGSTPSGGKGGAGGGLQEALNKRFSGGGGSLTPREDERDAAEQEARAKMRAASAGGTQLRADPTDYSPDYTEREGEDVDNDGLTWDTSLKQYVVID